MQSRKKKKILQYMVSLLYCRIFFLPFFFWFNIVNYMQATVLHL